MATKSNTTPAKSTPKASQPNQRRERVAAKAAATKPAAKRAPKAATITKETKVTTATPDLDEAVAALPAEARKGFEWPKPSSEVFLDYLTAEVTDATDAPNRAKPFINQSGVLHVHSSDWREWLVTQGLAPSKGEAAVPLREAGMSVRAFPLPGEGRSLGFYIGQAPAGTDDLPRRVAQRAARQPAGAKPFGRLTTEQVAVLTAALTAWESDEQGDIDVRDELIVQLPS